MTPQPARLRFLVTGGLISCLLTLPLSVANAAAGDEQHTPDLPTSDLYQVGGQTIAAWRQTMKSLDPHHPGSRQYVPGLIAILQSAEVPAITRRQAALTLGRMGSLAIEAIPVLTSQLHPPPATTAEEHARRSDQIDRAARALALFGPLAAASVPQLIAAYQDGDTSGVAGFSILDALSQTGIAHPAAVPFLLSVAADPPQLPGGLQHAGQTFRAEDFRRSAIEALGLIGPSAAVAVPSLLRALEAPDESIRREAAVALGKIGTSAAVAATALTERLILDESPAVQDRAADALSLLGPAIAGPLIVPFLQDDSPETRTRVLGIFTVWGSQSRPWLPEVTPLCRDSRAGVRLAAAEALWQITGSARDAALRAVEEFSDPEHHVRRQALRLFERLGPERVIVLPQLAELRQDSRPEVRNVANKAWQYCRNDLEARPPE